MLLNSREVDLGTIEARVTPYVPTTVIVVIGRENLYPFCIALNLFMFIICYRIKPVSLVVGGGLYLHSLPCKESYRHTCTHGRSLAKAKVGNGHLCSANCSLAKQ